MNRLNLLFFAFLISFMHNFYSEFNTIFLQSFIFLFFSELISIKLFNNIGRNKTNQTSKEEDDSYVSDTEDDEKVEEKTETEKTETEKTETAVNKEDSEETEEESDSEGSNDEPVDITEGVDVNQMEILKLLNNYESLGDSGLMELKNKMLELDKLVEFYKNDTKKTKKE